MSMRNKLLGGVALLMAAFSLTEANAQTCTAAPTCAQLGYTMKKADCRDDAVLRCPFAVSDDNQVFCIKEAEVVIGAGDILYGDGTISKTAISSKTPIGVVFDATNRLAIALTDVKQDGSAGAERMHWTGNGYDEYDVPNLEKCTDYFTVTKSCGTDGRANTDALLACGSGCGGTPAATACNLYQAAGCSEDFCKKGKWFLPSLKDWNAIYQVKGLVNMTLISLGKDTLTTSSFYWSSTEYQYTGVWYLKISDGSIATNSGGAYSYYVRPIVKY